MNPNVPMALKFGQIHIWDNTRRLEALPHTGGRKRVIHTAVSAPRAPAAESGATMYDVGLGPAGTEPTCRDFAYR
eukprot:7384220-Prymnesium_polylepis.1